MSETEEKPRGDLTTRTLAMPGDANPSGDIFGGWVLSQMDIAAGIAAGHRAQGRVATVAIDAMSFIRPVYVGDVMCVYAEVEKTGRTSMTIRLEAWALRNRLGSREKVTEGRFIFVAIDEDRIRDQYRRLKICPSDRTWSLKSASQFLPPIALSAIPAMIVPNLKFPCPKD